MKMSIDSPMKRFDNYLYDNRVNIEETYQIELQSIKKIFDIEYFIALKHIAFMETPYIEEGIHTRIAATAFVKNMYTIYSAYNLTINGLVGSARILMRHIFEFLIIGKYASVSQDLKFIAKWENGRNISMRRDVFSHILHPNSEEIKRLWELMCEYTHGTIYSQQLDLESNKISRDIRLNLLWIRMFLEMNYHLLISHIINNSMKYYTEQFADLYAEVVGEENEITHFKKEIKELFKISKEKMEREPRKVIYDYKLKWLLKKQC